MNLIELRTDKSFLVPFDEIKDNDWDLSINRYKEIIYEEIEYAAPSEIIKDIETLIKKEIKL
jgi:type I restriction enzyme M protein